MDWIVKSIFYKELDLTVGEFVTIIKPWMFFVTIGVAIALGLVAAFCYMFKNQYYNLYILLNISIFVYVTLIFLRL